MDNKFKEIFDQYDFSFTSSSVKEKVNEIIEKEFNNNNNKAVYSKLLGLVDLTSLNSEDSYDKIVELTEKVNSFDDNFDILPHPASICVYPSMISAVKETLSENVDIAAVAGFPHSQTFTEVKVAEVAMCVMEGATEIDFVMPVGKFLSGAFLDVYDEIQEVKSSCRNAKLKVIIESGLIKNLEFIKKASILAMTAGADFIKTSTGKGYDGASLEAAFIMCSAIMEYHKLSGIKVGFKASGGISDTEDAVRYYSVVNSVLGEKWLDSDGFRIGASKLVNNLLSSIIGSKVNYF